MHINNYQCLDDIDAEKHNLKGIYTDEEFSYYEFIVKSKYKNNKTHFNLINKYLIENDCKLQFYYTDIIVDVDDFKKPIKSFMNSLFLQMNPILIQKKNVFFMNYHLIDYKKYLHVLEEDEDEKKETTTGFSRVEDYSIFAGLNRYSDNSPDKEIYANLYIRVDNKEVTIKRKYQDIMEFYADCSSLLLSVFWLLCIIMGIIEKVKAKHSIGKKLFFFEGIEDNNFDKFQKLKKIIKENQEKEININKLKIENFDKSLARSRTYTRRKLNQNFARKDSISVLTTSTEKKEEKSLIKYSSYNINEMIVKNTCSCCTTKNFKSKINLIKQSGNSLDDKLDIVLYVRNMILFEKINQIYLENKSIINFLSRPIIYLNEEEEKEKKKKEKEEVKIKEFEISISREENEVTMDNEFYKSAYKLDSDKLYTKIKKLIQKPEKTKTEKKIIALLEDQLKGV